MSSFLSSVESQSLNAVVAGFSFAAAISWMDVVRWIIATFIKVNKTSGSFTVLAAVATTVMAVAVYMLLKMISPDIKQPQTVYAVTA